MACTFEFDRVWIEQPLAPDAGPVGAIIAAPGPAPGADARIAGTLPDAAPAAPTSGTGGTWTCAQIDDCCMDCHEDDDSCRDACFHDGTTEARRTFDAMFACFDQGFDGVCQSSCADPGSDFCWDCLESACAAQVNACYLAQP